MIWIGFLFSLLLWALLCAVALKATLSLHKGNAISEKWLLLVPFLLASLLFFAIRYRFAQHFFSFDTIHRFFAIGAYWSADLFVLLSCLPLFYMISVLRPDWVIRFWTNVPLLVFLPFALKLALFFTGIAPWEEHPAALQPTRLE
jgi:hypothetical protein